MAREMTGPGTSRGGISSIAQRVAGQPSQSGKVGGKQGPLGRIYLSQLIPALLIVLLGVINM